MKTWALLLYGVSVGIVIAWSLAVFVSDPSPVARWYAISSGAALAAGLILHQRVIAHSKGRRWRRTHR